MKFFTAIAALVVSMAASLTAVAGAPTPDVDTGAAAAAFDIGFLEILPRDPISSCNECREYHDLCMKYGFGQATGIVHCEQACMGHLCRKWPDCRKCDAKYDHCQDEFVNTSG